MLQKACAKILMKSALGQSFGRRSTVLLSIILLVEFVDCKELYATLWLTFLAEFN